MFKININVEGGRWKTKVPKIKKILSKNFKSTFSNLKKFHNKNLEMSVLLTDKKNMKILNKKFRKTFKDTDVLSFPNYEKKFFLTKITNNYLYLGDLALSYDYIIKQKINFLDYLNKIFIHGCLHLVGYEHNNEKNFKKMNLLEKKIISKI